MSTYTQPASLSKFITALHCNVYASGYVGIPTMTDVWSGRFPQFTPFLGEISLEPLTL
jgi:hypothetical protein